MKIGEVAKQTGLSVKSIRYYHDIGLVCGERNEAGYRVYRHQDIEALKFVHQCRDLGFSLEDCKSLLGLKGNESRNAEDVKQLTRTHLAYVEEQINKLQQLRAQLQHMVTQCQGGDQPHCAIIDSLSHEDHETDIDKSQKDQSLQDAGSECCRKASRNSNGQES
ncbi:MerR family DNA-binding protein [Shewanella baltica]|uniref:HTH-type transcriptional regulator CueR n=1 Tax=Shewanella scandinavica TaxID=3063538 RepID=A0ABU3FWF6_9GAMM|nr:MerR family DNA-binding protein [Shewanella sp. SP2S1-2]MDT3279714.1 MerR family DNA-binding protein [Shewanella sp. SP2S1-2]